MRQPPMIDPHNQPETNAERRLGVIPQREANRTVDRLARYQERGGVMITDGDRVLGELIRKIAVTGAGVTVTILGDQVTLDIAAGGGGGAPTTATYITQTANAGLSAEQALASLSTGMMQSTTTTGVVQTRTLTGTANEITVTNGDGSAGNPTFGLASGINAAKIGGGSVSSTEFDYLANVTSDIQTQINSRVADTGDTMTGALVVNPAAAAPITAQIAGTSYMMVDASGDVELLNSSALQFFSDNGTTRKLTLQGNTGYIFFGTISTSNASIKAGTGSPEGVVSSQVGSLWLRTDGGTDTAVYRKESGTGNTGWVAVSSSGSGLGFAAVQRLIAIGAPL